MGVGQHPSKELRSAYRIGDIAPGLGLALAAHLDFCRQCRVGLVPTGWPVLTSSLQVAANPEPSAISRSNHELLPPALRDHEVGRWGRIARGIRTAPVLNVSGLGESVHLVKVASAAALNVPSAADFLLVLRGSFGSDGASFAPGDFLDLSPLRAKTLTCLAEPGGLLLMIGDDQLYAPFLGGWLSRLFGR